MPFRYNALSLKYLLERKLAAEVPDADEYRRIASELERMSSDPNLKPEFKAQLAVFVSQLNEFAGQEESHKKALVEMLHSLGFGKKLEGSPAPSAGSPSAQAP